MSKVIAVVYLCLLLTGCVSLDTGLKIADYSIHAAIDFNTFVKNTDNNESGK